MASPPLEASSSPIPRQSTSAAPLPTACFSTPSTALIPAPGPFTPARCSSRNLQLSAPSLTAATTPLPSKLQPSISQSSRRQQRSFNLRAKIAWLEAQLHLQRRPLAPLL